MAEMEDLDAELLAVTDGQKRANRTEQGVASDSEGAEFEGIADSEEGDDDDEEMLDDGGGFDEDDDDDDDDHEYGLDEDDEDFGRKSLKKKKAPKQSKAKKRSTKRKQQKRKPRSADKVDLAEDKDLINTSDSEDALFTYKYDQNGYGDAADQEKLAEMNEVDREILLNDRIEARNKEHLLWKKKREMMARNDSRVKASSEKRMARSSGRSKPSSKSDALQALAADKRKKSVRPPELDVSDADSEPDASNRTRESHLGFDEKEKREEVDAKRDDAGPSLKYTDLVTDNKGGVRVTSPLFLRRSTLAYLSQQPYFERAVVGLYARVRALSRGDDSYLLCKIVGVSTGRIYEIDDNTVSNLHLTLQSGRQQKSFAVRLTSGSAPSEAEFDAFCKRSLRDDVDLPRREEIAKLSKRSQDLIVNRNALPTDQELKKHVANMELLYPARVNWTQKLTEAKTALAIKKQDLATAVDRGAEETISKYKTEVDTMEDRLAKVRTLEEKYVLKPVRSNADVFQSLAKRNMALNNSNERLVASRQNQESAANGANPFARFDTTGQSYFSIKPRGGEDPSAKADPNAQLNSRTDWRSLARTWNPSEKRRKVSELAPDPAYDTPLSSLGVFEKDDNTSSFKKVHSLLPPMVDAVYSNQACARSNLPKGAKTLSFEEWSRQRAGG